MLRPSSSRSSGPEDASLSAAMVTTSPFMGSLFRNFASSLRNLCHSSLSRPSSTGMAYLPAVSRIIACSKNHQSKFRVPDMPEARRISTKGEESRALCIAVVFPEPLSPITIYHGRTYRGFPYFLRWDFLSAVIASFHRSCSSFEPSFSLSPRVFK